MKDPLQEPSSYIEEQGTLFWVALAPPWGLAAGGWLGTAYSFALCCSSNTGSKAVRNESNLSFPHCNAPCSDGGKIASGSSDGAAHTSSIKCLAVPEQNWFAGSPVHALPFQPSALPC